MPTPAIRKVQDALKALLDAELTGVTVFIDRTVNEPLIEGEWPGVVIRMVKDDMSLSLDQHQTEHRVTVQFDCQSGNTTLGTIDLINQQTIADIVAAIAQDRTLGGRLEDMEETLADASEQSGQDIGCAILQAELIYYTPRGDLYTIVGVGGATF